MVGSWLFPESSFSGHSSLLEISSFYERWTSRTRRAKERKPKITVSDFFAGERAEMEHPKLPVVESERRCSCLVSQLSRRKLVSCIQLVSGVQSQGDSASTFLGIRSDSRSGRDYGAGTMSKRSSGLNGFGLKKGKRCRRICGHHIEDLNVMERMFSRSHAMH